MAEPNGNLKQQDEQAQAKTQAITHDKDQSITHLPIRGLNKSIHGNWSTDDKHQSLTRLPTRGLNRSIHRNWSIDRRHEIGALGTVRNMQNSRTQIAAQSTPEGRNYWPTQGEHRGRAQGTVRSKQRRATHGSTENKHESRWQGAAQSKQNGQTQMSTWDTHRSMRYRRTRGRYKNRARRSTHDRNKQNIEAEPGQTGKQDREDDSALPQQTEYDLMDGYYRMPGRVRSSSHIAIREQEGSPECGAWSDPN